MSGMFGELAMARDEEHFPDRTGASGGRLRTAFELHNAMRPRSDSPLCVFTLCFKFVLSTSRDECRYTEAA